MRLPKKREPQATCPYCKVFAVVKSAVTTHKRTGVPPRLVAFLDSYGLRHVNRIPDMYHLDGHPGFGDIARICYLPRTGVERPLRAYLERHLPLEAFDACQTVGVLYHENRKARGG